MALRARNAFPRGRATLNPLRPFHSPRPGPTLAHGIRAGSQRAAEPRKRENTTSRKRKKGQREKKTHLYTCTRLPFNEWDVSREVTQAGMPQGKVINRHQEVLVAWGLFLKNATFRDKLAFRHIKWKWHVSWHVLYFVRDDQSKYQAAASHSEISIGSSSTPYSLTYSKQYSAATSMVASNSRSSSSTSSPSLAYSKHQHHTIATIVCWQFKSNRSSTLLYALPYIP